VIASQLVVILAALTVLAPCAALGLLALASLRRATDRLDGGDASSTRLAVLIAAHDEEQVIA